MEMNVSKEVKESKENEMAHGRSRGVFSHFLRE
jgi:hypothetical protein